MTTMTAGANFNIDMEPGTGGFADLTGGTVQSYTDSEVVVQSFGTYTFTGTGFHGHNAQGLPTRGTINELDLALAGDPAGTFADFAMSWQRFNHLVATDNYRSFLLALTRGDDTITGADHDDYIVGSTGNDALTGAGGNDKLFGGAGNDTAYGGSDNDLLNTGGGTDADYGGDGNDVIAMGASLDATDTIDGGTGLDTLTLGGGLAAYAFGAAQLTNVEILTLGGAFDYDLTTADANVAAHSKLVVSSVHGDAAHHITFDGSAETNGHFVFRTGAGDDVLKGGARAEQFFLGRGGVDSAYGGDGHDVFRMGGAMTDTDTIDGGAGRDVLLIDGQTQLQMVLDSHVTGIETIRFLPGTHSYNIRMTTTEVINGQTQVIDASALQSDDSFIFSGADIANAHFFFTAGQSYCALTGGDMVDIYDLTAGVAGQTIDAQGKGGGDFLTCGAANDSFSIGPASDSTSTHYDSVFNFDTAHDTFNTGVTVSSVATGSSNQNGGNTLDDDLGLACSGSLGPNGAVVITFSGSDFHNQTYLVIDADGTAGYTAGADIVVGLTDFTGTFTTANFI